MNRKITSLIARRGPRPRSSPAFLGDIGSASSQRQSTGNPRRAREDGARNVLVDSRGRTLYMFEKDKGGRSACYGACATYWPPLVSSAKPRAARGVRASLLGLTKRTDGKRQVTYASHPLYTFVLDTRAGQTSGQGLKDFGGSWDAVAASGRAVKSTTSSGSSGGTNDGYGGYGSGG